MSNKKFHSFTTAELFHKELEPVPYVVDGILPAGLSIFAGLGKVGKSWFVYWLCMQVAKGEEVWGFQTSKGTTLYLAFEDNENRLQDRLFVLSDDAPDNAHLCIEVAKMGGELETRIRNFMVDYSDTKLIVIDTLQKVRTSGNESNYMNDYDDLSILKTLADEYKIAIVIVHHLRKQKDSDVFNQITGSTGLQGACDNMYVLAQGKRGEGSATLSCLGRDVIRRELELERGEDMIWIKTSDSMAEASVADLKFIKAIEELMKERDKFVGTATELSSLIQEKRGDKISNKMITRMLKRLSLSLKSLGITATNRKSNGNRIIEIVAIRGERDEESSTDIVDPIVPMDTIDSNKVDDITTRKNVE